MTVPRPSVPKPPPDWGAPRQEASRRGGMRTAIHIGLLLAMVIVVTVLTVMTRDVRYVLVAIVVMIAGVRLASREGRRALGAVAAVEIGASDREHARLVRLVSGLSGDLGIEPPGIWMFTTEDRNAFVTPAGSHGAIAMSTDLASELALTELEAVVAHCLLRLREGHAAPRWARAVRGWTGRTDPCTPASFDVGAAALTRYPPGLAGAIRKVRPREGGDRGMWFVPAAEGRCSPAGRIARLEDL